MSATYDCRFCGNAVEATPADLESAREYEREVMHEDGSIEASDDDQQLMDRFGRDICDQCTGDKPASPYTSTRYADEMPEADFYGE